MTEPDLDYPKGIIPIMCLSAFVIVVGASLVAYIIYWFQTIYL